MPETDLFLIFARKLVELELPFMVTGSIAGVLYGEPRVTHDVDIVLELRGIDAVRRVAASFPIEEFYCPPEEVLVEESNRSQRGHFNLIHHQSGFRADIYLANRDPFHRWALGERRFVRVDDVHVPVAPPEYVIVRKLEFYREGGSEKHIRDIAAIRSASAKLLREDVLDTWIDRLGVRSQWETVLAYEL